MQTIMMQVQKTVKSIFFQEERLKTVTLIDGRNWKLLTGQDNEYATGCLLDYAYFKDSYRLTALDLNKQKALDADPRAIQQIVF